MTHEHLTPDLFDAILDLGWRHTGASGNTEYFTRRCHDLIVSHDEKGWRVAAIDNRLREHIEIGADLLQAVKLTELWLSAEAVADF
jgi:hypothetical protein